MIRVGIVGGTGYTGVEVLRLLAGRSDVEVIAITSRGADGQRVDSRFPNLRGVTDLVFETPSAARLSECDIVFFATPNGTAMEQAPALLDSGVRVVDVSADFRLRDRVEYAHWYGREHAAPDWLAQAVYGLPEVHREAIRGARLVANPGCYPTTIQLGLLPLVEAGVVDPRLRPQRAGGSAAGRDRRQHPRLRGRWAPASAGDPPGSERCRSDTGGPGLRAAPRAPDPGDSCHAVRGVDRGD
jgi:N-acetyl-gamma-glutamyl-phosphate reductase